MTTPKKRRNPPDLQHMADSLSLLVAQRGAADWEAAHILSRIAALGAAYADERGFAAWAASFAELEQRASAWSGWVAREETEADPAGK